MLNISICHDTILAEYSLLTIHNAAFELQVKVKTLQTQFEGLEAKERWGAGVETQKNVREEIGGWGRVPFDEPYAPSLSTIYDGA